MDNFINILLDAINFKLKLVKESEISSAIGIWLSQSNDREGGRKERQPKDDSPEKEKETENETNGL